MTDMANTANLGKLKVDLVLDRAAFQRGIDQARSGIQKFSDNVNKRLAAIGNVPGLGNLQKVLSSVNKGIGAAVATGMTVAATAMAGLSISAINAASEIQNLSRVANAAPAEFQGWAAGARAVGIEQDKLADILKDMNDRVGDFIATGGGPMKDFFERIAPKVGVTADQFRKLSGPEALQLYVSSLEKANVNQQDFTFFMEAIASDSTALVPLLRNGGKAMKEYADRTAALGGIMSNESVRSLSAMKKSLSEVGVVMRGVRNELGAAFAPIIQSVAQTFVSLMTKGSALRMVFDGLVTIVRTLANYLSSLVTIISAVVSGIWDFVRSAQAAIEKATGIGEAFRWLIANSPVGWIYSLVTGFAQLIRAQGGLGGAIKALGQLATAVWGAMVESAKAIPKGLSAVWLSVQAGFMGMVQKLQSMWGDFLYSMAGTAESVFGDTALTRGLYRASTTANKAATAAIDAIAAKQREAATASEGAAKMVENAWAPVNALWTELSTVTEEAANELGGGGAAGGGLAGAADKAGKSAGSAKQKMSDLQNVLKSLRDEAAKLKATLWMGETDAAIWDNLNKAGVSAASKAGQEITGLTRNIDAMKKLKSATEEWRDSMKSAFTDLVAKGGSFRDALSNIISKLAEMVANSAFDSIWKGIGGSAKAGGLLSWIGIGANANGTPSWQGGMTRVNERGGEILNLPRGTQIIPHDISKRMADNASDGFGGGHISLGFDSSTGSFTAMMRDVAGNVVAEAAPRIQSGAVGQTLRANKKSKSMFG